MTDEFTKTVVIGNGPMAQLDDNGGSGTTSPAATNSSTQTHNDPATSYGSFEETSWLT